MKKYIGTREDFASFLENIELEKYISIFTEDLEGSVSEYKFLKVAFTTNIIILYEHPYGQVGVIQDTFVAPWEDYAEGVYDDLTMNDEYKLFIESK